MTAAQFKAPLVRLTVDTATEQIDAVCIDVEDRLRDGHSVRIEDELRRVEEPLRAELFEQLLLLTLHYSNGKTSKKEWCERYPRYRNIVSRVFRQQAVLKWREPQPGDRIGRYEIRELIGEGGFGRVYSAMDHGLHRMVALKAPRLGTTATRQAAERFQQEARALAQLRHPNIMTVFDVISDDEGWPYMVMECLQPIPDDIQHDTDKLRRLFADVAHGLEYAHQQNIIHRDLKPDNILLGAQQQAVVTDFGLALEYETSHTERNTAGTLQYMSPEQIRGQTHWMDGRSDIWAVGVMLYEAVSGRPPFTGTNEQIASAILGKAVRPPRQIDPAIPADLERICLKCLQKSPEDRYATSGDLAGDLAESTDFGQQATGNIWKTVAIAQTAAFICLALFFFLRSEDLSGEASHPEQEAAQNSHVPRPPENDDPSALHGRSDPDSSAGDEKSNVAEVSELRSDKRPRLADYPVSLPIPDTYQATSGDTQLHRGDHALICWARKWNPVEIISVSDELVHIRFEGWDTEYRVPRDNLAVRSKRLTSPDR